MNLNGWFKMYRKIFSHKIWQDIPLFRLFIYLVGNAVFSEKGVDIGELHIKRGQYLRSYRNIREDLKYVENNAEKYYSLSHIKNMVEVLTKNGMIEAEPLTLGTLFTIVNYAKYQDSESKYIEIINELRTEKEHLEEKLRTQRERRENNNKNVKKDKKVIKEKKNKDLSTYAEKIKEIYDCWIKLLSDINNANLTKLTKEKILTKLKRWNKDIIIQGIKNYNEIYRSDYYYSHNWTLQKIIEQSNGLPRFIPGLDQKYDGDIWKDYQKSNIPKKDSKMEQLKELYLEYKEEGENEKGRTC